MKIIKVGKLRFKPGAQKKAIYKFETNNTRMKVTNTEKMTRNLRKMTRKHDNYQLKDFNPLFTAASNLLL